MIKKKVMTNRLLELAGITEQWIPEMKKLRDLISIAQNALRELEKDSQRYQGMGTGNKSKIRKEIKQHNNELRRVMKTLNNHVNTLKK